MINRVNLNTLWNLIKILLALILIFFVLRQINVTDILALRGQILWYWLVASFVIYCSMTLFKAFQYYELLGRPIPYQRVLSLVLAQNAISNFIANSAGVLSFITLIYKDDGVRVRKATAVFFITKVGDLVCAWLALIATALVLWRAVATLHILLIVLIGIIALGFVGFAFIVLQREVLILFLKGLAEKLGLYQIKLVLGLFDLLELIASQERAVILSLLIKSVFLSFTYYLLTIAWSLMSFRAFSISLNYLALIFIITLMQLLSIVPIQVFGGLGVSETVNIYLFGLFGYLESQIVPALLGMRIVFYAMNALILLYFPIRFLVNKIWPVKIAYE